MNNDGLLMFTFPHFSVKGRSETNNEALRDGSAPERANTSPSVKRTIWQRIATVVTLAGALLMHEASSAEEPPKKIPDTPGAGAKDHPEARPPHLTLDELEKMVPKRVLFLTLEDVLQNGLVQCVDGRNKNPRGIDGVPGGDAGVCLAVLSALEDLLMRPLTAIEVEAFVMALPGTEYMHTDTHALKGHDGMRDGLIQEILDTQDPVLCDYINKTRGNIQALLDNGTGDAAADEKLISILKRGKAQGCKHMGLAATSPRKYKVRAGLSEDIISATLRRKWKPSTHDRTIVDPLEHTHRERAVVQLEAPDTLASHHLVPVFLANAAGGQCFVLAPKIVRHRRVQQFVDVAYEQFDVDKKKLIEAADQRLTEQTDATAHLVANGLPKYLIRCDGKGNVIDVTDEGVIK